ncbi:hypothetical protein JX266_010624 [Neoarthrinium moseri]|nr:hypothetical protein JX266_010624 [Neoarthrinium moseri]
MAANFKVVIVGGGVAGLTLANMLEKFDIDYTLLEAYSAIAPPVGASIGLFPNGLRILDQIGCLESIERVAQGTLKYTYMRDKNGKVKMTLSDMQGHLEKRHGYAGLIFDRQWLLQILYDQLEHKDRVLVNKRVANIKQIDGGVEVSSQDGYMIRGAIVIGADGIHSVVRSEMFRLGNELQPGYFEPDQEDKVPCYYKCSFGIAQNVPGWKGDEQHFVLGQRKCQLVMSGPGDRVYWFLFVQLPETKYGKNIPRYTKEDEAELVEEYFDLPITENITFGQVYAKRISSTLTPLHEVVYKKWFFKRVLILGDAAHKPNPIGGQGGNAAIESAAELVNAILDKRDRHTSGLAKLEDRDIEEIFSVTQETRIERANLVVQTAHEMQALNAYEKPLLSRLVWDMVAPYMGDEMLFNQLNNPMIGGARLKRLPVPRPNRTIPFADELPEKPIGPAISRFMRAAFTGGMLLSLWRNAYGGSAEARGFYPNSQLISALVVFTVEGNRIGNQGSLLAAPSLFTAGMPFFGQNSVLAVHSLLSAYQAFTQSAGRYVKPQVASSLLPALVSCFGVSYAVYGTISGTVGASQKWTTLAQVAAPLFPIMTNMLSAAKGYLQRRNTAEAKQNAEPYFDRYRKGDVPTLKLVYGLIAGLQGAAHVAAQLSQMYQNVPRNAIASWAPWLLSLLQRRLVPTLMSQATLIGSNLYTVWELRRLGYISWRQALKTSVYAVAGQFVIGPGATWMALWRWREGVIADLERQ